MSEPMLDTVARRTVNAIDRKTVMKVLGAASAALAVPSIRAAVAKPGKKKKKGNSKCQSQLEQCHAFLRESLCRPLEMRIEVEAEGLEPSPDCIDFYTSCCEAFASCDAAAGFPCLLRPRPDVK